MKYIFCLVTMMVTFSASALELVFDCMGFPSGARFECTLENGKTYTFDIPDGHGCNQPPATGTVDGIFKIFKPRFSFDAQMNRIVSFSTTPKNDRERQEFQCL